MDAFPGPDKKKEIKAISLSEVTLPETDHCSFLLNFTLFT